MGERTKRKKKRKVAYERLDLLVASAVLAAK